MRLNKSPSVHTEQAEHDDDIPVGRILSRREMLKALAGAGTVLAAAGYGTAQAGSLLSGKSLQAEAASQSIRDFTAGPSGLHAVRIPSCVVRPALTEGPYFVDELLNRSDIRIDTATGEISEGVLLQMTFDVSQVNGGCAPLQGVMVDIWQTDAFGRYSDVGQYVGHNWLRGFQITDQNGIATFTTIYPGWYPGRTVHTHIKLRIGNYTFTSQLFFDDLLTDQVFLQQPYVQRGPRSTRNPDDGIYQNGGSQMLLTVVPDGQGGYTTTFDIGLAITGGTPIPTTTAVATGTALATSTPQPTSTTAVTNTPQATGTTAPTETPTELPTGTSTPQVTATVAPCQVSFSDVNQGDYFYEAVNYLACNGVVSGYSDGTFRPYNNATRAQFVKMVVLSQGWTLLNPLTPTFSDVAHSNPFYQVIETAVARGIISGYADNTFRPNTDVTRGQVCKIIALAHGWTLINPGTPRFSDVPRDHTFYRFIETAAAMGVVTGYADGTFSVGNPATRGQIAKIIYQALAG